MNFMKFINSDYLKSNPLCGIGTYKDELNLATGACTRQIKKLVLTGQEETINFYNGSANGVGAYLNRPDMLSNSRSNGFSTHFLPQSTPSGSQIDGVTFGASNTYIFFTFSSDTATALNLTDLNSIKAWFQQQYAAGTPVTVWYVLATPTTETITVPSGLSGTEEGYLTRSGTPTPTNPIYPTANTVENWFDLKHYIMGTSTDTITTLPADIYADGNNATVGLKGNMSQTGTPTPQSPIQPSETGEMTENLLATLTENYAIDASGNINSNSFFMYYTAPCDANETYTFSLDSGLSGNTVRIHAFNGDTWIEQLSGRNINLAPFTVTTPANTTNLKISITKDAKTYHTMLNVGETPLPYEPYGYKIPISSANTTTPVYLSEMQSTRKIKQLVLTGDEDWQLQSINSHGIANFWVFDYLTGINSDRSALCTHFYQTTASIADVTEPCFSISTTSASLYLRIQSTTASDATEFKSYLQQQYAAGTPVCVWYVLAEPTTGIVNEPLRKIGGYADEVSGITIPTIAGANTLTVDTTLQPSEITANYKGWHPVADVHERENGAWV